MENNIKTLNDIVRRDVLSGSAKVIIGDKFSDLVLETLGKIYIKSGRKLSLLTDIVNNISETSLNNLNNKTIIVNSQLELENLEYPGEGYFIFNTLSGILYISLDNRYIALINALEFSESGYVKKSGDVMTGPLEIKSDDANLIISSNKIIKNLNSSYLNGFTDLDFAKRNIDEKINGNWSIEGKWKFNKPTSFNENIRSRKDYITDGSLGSPEFASGFSGYGWRLDASTNTFTIDNLVVRKLMMIYEMVINKITATNGSLWVSNSSKIESVQQVKFIYPDYTKYVEDSYSVVSTEEGLSNNKYYLFGEEKFIDNTGIASSTKIPENGVNKFKPVRLQHLNNSPTFNIISFLDSGIFIEDEDPEIYDINNNELLEASFNAVVEDQDVDILTYYKYFASSSQPIVNNCYVIETDKKEYPMFREGDILRCQKYSLGAMKYYDAIVLLHIADRSYLIQVIESVFDKYTELEYDENGNLIDYKEEYNETLYNKTNKALNDNGEYVYTSKSYENEDGSYNGESSLSTVQEGDDLIHIGNIYNTDRQGVLYLTATDDQGPYIDVLDGINRPDYSVLYKTGDNKYNKPTKVRLGKLDGIYNPIFGGNQPKGYGLYGENVYLTGEFYLNNGKSVASFADDIQLIVGDLDNTITEKVKEQTDALKEDFVQHDDLENAGIHIGEDTIVLWADAIKIATEKADIDDPNEYTALFTDGKIKGDLLEVNELNAISETIVQNVTINDTTYTLLGASYDEISVADGELKIPADQYIYISINQLIYTYDGDAVVIFVGIPGEYYNIPTSCNKIIFSEYNTDLEVSNINKEYKSLSINTLDNGEIINYWNDGSVMNCKIFKFKDNELAGCVEFFFDKGICSLDHVKQGYEYLNTQVQYRKKVDYFAESSEININNNYHYSSETIRSFFSGYTFEDFPIEENLTTSNQYIGTLYYTNIFKDIIYGAATKYEYGQCNKIDGNCVLTKTDGTAIDVTKYLYDSTNGIISVHKELNTLLNNEDYRIDDENTDTDSFHQLLYKASDAPKDSNRNTILVINPIYSFSNDDIFQMQFTLIKLIDGFKSEIKTINWTKDINDDNIIENDSIT